MQFYLALSADGQTKILGTQADAKAVNKDFQAIEIPTDKPGLMAWIQQMLDETLNAQPGTKEEVDTSDIPEATEEFFEKAVVREPEPKHLGNRAAIKEGTVCSICARTPKGVKIMEQVFNAMDVELAISQMDTVLRCNTVIAQAVARKRKLAAEGVLD